MSIQEYNKLVERINEEYCVYRVKVSPINEPIQDLEHKCQLMREFIDREHIKHKYNELVERISEKYWMCRVKIPPPTGSIQELEHKCQLMQEFIDQEL